MRFIQTPLAGSFLVRLDEHRDERGGFARAWCREEFAAAGLAIDFAQWSISENTRRGTLRGLHYQTPPHDEVKLVACGRGRIFDVIVDLRPDSPTRARWFGCELSADDATLMLVPEGFAHGFLTLEDHATVHYHISKPHNAEAARGVRWNDPAFAIVWPFAPTVICERDATYPDYRG